MVSFMGSLVYDWLLSAGDEKLAKKFKKEAKAEPLPPNSPRLADIVKHYKETSPQKRKAEPVVNGSAKKAKKVALIWKIKPIQSPEFSLQVLSDCSTSEFFTFR